MSSLTMRSQRASDGELRHVPAPRDAATAAVKGKKARPPRDPIKATCDSDGVSAKQLALLIERIERLEEEKRGIGDDIKDVYAEAKSTGFDVKTMKAIIRLRGMQKEHRDEADMLLETYKVSLGLA